MFDDSSGAVFAQGTTAPDDRTDIAATCTPLQALLLRGDLSGAWAAAVTGLSVTATQHLLAVPDGHVADAFDHNDGRPIAGVRSYACLMRPGDHDTDPGTPRAWSPRPLAPWQLTQCSAKTRLPAMIDAWFSRVRWDRSESAST